MPKAKETLRVDITEQTNDETRTIIITLTAPAQDFLLSDLLRQRGAVGSVQEPLKASLKDTVQTYLDDTEALVAGLAGGQRKASAGAKPKTKDGVNGNANGHAPGDANGAPVPALSVTINSEAAPPLPAQ